VKTEIGHFVGSQFTHPSLNSFKVIKGHLGSLAGDEFTMMLGKKMPKINIQVILYLIWLYGGELFGLKLWIVKMLKVYTKL